MKKISFAFFIAAIAITSCKQQGFKKGDEGMEYKIIAYGKGDIVKPGEFIEFHITSILQSGKKDSILNSSREQGAAQIMTFDSISLPPAYYKLFKQMKNGDSLCTKVLTDSIFKKQPEAMPPFMKKGDFIFTNVKIVNIFKTQAEADKAKAASMAAAQEFAKKKAEAQLVKDDKILTDYFAKNNIKATKTPQGAYVEILTPGTGANLDTTTFAKVNYTGKTLDGKMFDSNTQPNADPTRTHLEPLSVNLTNDMSLGSGVIPGFSDGLRMMNKGAKGKIYIPSSLGYGAAGNGGDIAPNANIVFDIEVLDVLSKDRAISDMKEAQIKMQLLQKKYTDSVAKANPQAQQQQAPPSNQPR